LGTGAGVERMAEIPNATKRNAICTRRQNEMSYKMWYRLNQYTISDERIKQVTVNFMMLSLIAGQKTIAIS